jgi:iron(II)-dependent oxidoreductase
VSADGRVRIDPTLLRSWIEEAGARTRALTDDLTADQRLGPQLPIVNPLRWEVGHVGWFYSFFVLREGLGETPERADEDALYDSMAIAHHRRWSLPLPDWTGTLGYLDAVRGRVLAAVDRGDERIAYLAYYALAHEDMHGEAFTYSRQTLGYPAPATGRATGAAEPVGPLGDVDVAGGTVKVGAEPGTEAFVFDNEKWAEVREVAPFRIARTAVSRGELADFADDGGYARRELWTEAGWSWRAAERLHGPRYWRRADGGWQRRAFDRWIPIEPATAAIHVSYYEAEAYCRWAGRRLPTEAEWQAAAGAGRYPWGDDDPTAARANLDGAALGTVDVGALAAGDSPAGCRQMIGNVWEWTSSDFAPLAGFVPDVYADYSQPWFAGHKVLRGGAWTTRSRLIRTGYRNFYQPGRGDVLVGFRTCAR